MYCQNCGSKNEPDAIFCGNCGQKLEDSSTINLAEQESNSQNMHNSAATQGETVVDPASQVQFDAAAQEKSPYGAFQAPPFHEKMNTPTHNQPPMPPQGVPMGNPSFNQMPPKAKKSKTPVIVVSCIAAVLVVAIAVVCVLFVPKGGIKPANKPNTAAATSSSTAQESEVVKYISSQYIAGQQIQISENTKMCINENQKLFPNDDLSWFGSCAQTDVSVLKANIDSYNDRFVMIDELELEDIEYSDGWSRLTFYEESSDLSVIGYYKDRVSDSMISTDFNIYGVPISLLPASYDADGIVMAVSTIDPIQATDESNNSYVDNDYDYETDDPYSGEPYAVVVDKLIIRHEPVVVGGKISDSKHNIVGRVKEGSTVYVDDTITVSGEEWAHVYCDYNTLDGYNGEEVWGWCCMGQNGKTYLEPLNSDGD